MQAEVLAELGRLLGQRYGPACQGLENAIESVSARYSVFKTMMNARGSASAGVMGKRGTGKSSASNLLVYVAADAVGMLRPATPFLPVYTDILGANQLKFFWIGSSFRFFDSPGLRVDWDAGFVPDVVRMTRGFQLPNERMTLRESGASRFFAGVWNCVSWGSYSSLRYTNVLANTVWVVILVFNYVDNFKFIDDNGNIIPGPNDNQARNGLDYLNSCRNFLSALSQNGNVSFAVLVNHFDVYAGHYPRDEQDIGSRLETGVTRLRGLLNHNGQLHGIPFAFVCSQPSHALYSGKRNLNDAPSPLYNHVVRFLIDLRHQVDTTMCRFVQSSVPFQ